MSKNPQRRDLLTAALVAVGIGGMAIWAGDTLGSDHVDTAEVELSPTLDINDVYAFPGSNDGRIVLVLDVASPTNALGRDIDRFSQNALYQFKIDNDGDAVEDLVIQLVFTDRGGQQRVHVIGPTEPTDVGMVNRIIRQPDGSGDLDEVFDVEDMQVFAGTRSDPFYIDFEQFVRIIPDRRPATFLTDAGTATAFRPDPSVCNDDGDIVGDPGPFSTEFGCAENIFRGANTLSIVLEMPESRLGVGSGNDAQIGVWATISR